MVASCLAVGLASCNFIVNTLLSQWYLEFFTHRILLKLAQSEDYKRKGGGGGQRKSTLELRKIKDYITYKNSFLPHREHNSSPL
jgi:hypothetical protein